MTGVHCLPVATGVVIEELFSAALCQKRSKQEIDSERDVID